jgi:hypothetical protein
MVFFINKFHFSLAGRLGSPDPNACRLGDLLLPSGGCFQKEELTFVKAIIGVLFSLRLTL